MNIFSKIWSDHQDLARYIKTFLFGNCNHCHKLNHSNNIIRNITVYKDCIIDLDKDCIESEYIVKKSIFYDILCKHCYQEFLAQKFNMYIND